MTISGYAWGHIVASGPRQLGRDIRVLDTHPRPLDRAQKHLPVSAATVVATAVDLREPLSLLAYVAVSFILSILNNSPRFQRLKVIAASCLAIVKRAKAGSIPRFTRAS